MGACAVQYRPVGEEDCRSGGCVIRVELGDWTCVVPLGHLGLDSASEEYDVIASVAGYFDSTYGSFCDHSLVREGDGSLALVRE